MTPHLHLAALIAGLSALSGSPALAEGGPDVGWLQADSKAVQYSTSYRANAEAILQGQGQVRSRGIDAMYQLARAGYADAINFVGYMLDNGIGVQRDSKTAARYFAEGAKRGNRYAAHNLGVLYLLGRGVQPDANTGLKLLNESVKFRIPESSVVIGMYWESQREWGKAVQAYGGAKGFIDHPIAKARIGILMVKGLGIQQNIHEGRLLIEDAANMWWPEAQWSMVQLAQLGVGGKPDQWQAAWWATVLRANPLARGTPFEDQAVRLANGAGLGEQAWKEINGSTKIWIDGHSRYAKNINYWLTTSGPLQ